MANMCCDCCKTSCWPIRAIYSCFHTPTPHPSPYTPSIAVIHNVSVASLSSIPEVPTHTRTRTWAMIDGKMRYEIEEKK